MPMNPREALAIVAEARARLVPRKERQSAKRTWRFISDFHAKQLAFHQSKSKRKAAGCGRRAGKSVYACGALLEAAGDEPDSLCVYIALTRRQAKRILWKELKRFNRRYALGLTFNETELTCTLRNGSEIALIGANNEEQVDKLRGAPLVLAIIDEAGTFGEYLRSLIDEVLEPTMLDYDGTIVMLGTPNPTCTGFFYEVCTGSADANGKVPQGWDVHHWTVLDNPFALKHPTPEIPDAATWLRKRREAKGISESDPAWQREWLGLWVRSDSKLVYPRFSRPRNVYSAIPNEDRLPWQYGISIDLGYDDPVVMGLFKWSRKTPDVYLAWCLKKAGMVPTQIAAEIKRIEKQVGGLSFVVVDQGGGSGKIVSEEFRRVHGIACKGAEKNKKPTFIDFCNGDFATGRFKIHESCTPIFEEISDLQWHPDHPGKLEDERFPNDACDMMLYGWRETRPFDFAKDTAPAEMEAAPVEREEAEMIARIERGIRKQSNGDWWE